MKICSKCKRNLPDEEFYNSKQTKRGLSCWCKECSRINATRQSKEAVQANGRKMRKKIHNFVDSLKTHCAKCGNDTYYVLDFHHIDPATKKFSIGHDYRKKEVILEEAAKCICLCRNCHQTFHYFYGVRPTNPHESLAEFLDANWKPPIEKKEVG